MDRDVTSNASETITAIGDKGQAGTYLLHIALDQDIMVKFGQFQGGEPVALAAGSYLYVGSALGKSGSSSLGNRLQRHLLRTGMKPDHQLSSVFRLYASNIGLHYVDNPSPKTLFWNIDYLVDLQQAEVSRILFDRSGQNLESAWTEFIIKQDYSEIIRKGLGAHDSDDKTHLFFTSMSNDQWNELILQLPVQ